MTTIEWILSLSIVAALWIGALWYFFVESLREEQRKIDWIDARLDLEEEMVRNEIARWKEASTRTYERQGIRRNR